jgi:hypothetical protein
MLTDCDTMLVDPAVAVSVSGFGFAASPEDVPFPTVRLTWMFRLPFGVITVTVPVSLAELDVRLVGKTVICILVPKFVAWSQAEPVFVLVVRLVIVCGAPKKVMPTVVDWFDDPLGTLKVTGFCEATNPVPPEVAPTCKVIGRTPEFMLLSETLICPL